MSKKTVLLAARVDHAFAERVRKAAGADDNNVSRVLRMLLRDWLKKKKDRRAA